MDDAIKCFVVAVNHLLETCDEQKGDAYTLSLLMHVFRTFIDCKDIDKFESRYAKVIESENLDAQNQKLHAFISDERMDIFRDILRQEVAGVDPKRALPLSQEQRDQLRQDYDYFFALTSCVSKAYKQTCIKKGVYDIVLEFNGKEADEAAREMQQAFHQFLVLEGIIEADVIRSWYKRLYCFAYHIAEKGVLILTCLAVILCLYYLSVGTMVAHLPLVACIATTVVGLYAGMQYGGKNYRSITLEMTILSSSSACKARELMGSINAGKSAVLEWSTYTQILTPPVDAQSLQLSSDADLECHM